MFEDQPSVSATFLPPEDARGDRRTDVAAHTVSVVVPCYNEERFIGQVLEHLSGQYVGEGFEIIVVDGMSEDSTRETVAGFMRTHPSLRVRLIDNPARVIPVAVNRGIAAARGEVIVRMDAHSIPSPNYTRRCLELLRRADVAVVGMPWRIRPGADTLVARANALAVAHPFGIGDAKYRTADETAPSQFVDTVAFGVFTKKLWQELGGFNEDLLANEDYDFNYRVRQRGGGVLLDTSGHCLYFARATFGALTRQYFRYGTWKAQMLKLHPRSARLRHLVAPAFVLALALLSLSCWWLKPARWALVVMLAAYASLALAASLQLLRRDRESRLLLLLPLSFLLIHLTWGGGFLWGLVRPAAWWLKFRGKDRRVDRAG
jgi:glycosyltransferase involved in cell wall biosynthesis